MATASTSDEETLIEDRNPTKANRIAIDDWSQTGRGSHVEFEHGETVPLSQDRFLGRGAIGDVYETTVQGHKLAHKRIVAKRKIGDSDRKEIEILKRLSSHCHTIQLVGTYTHRQFLGILLYPVAVCDLHTFFTDVEAWSSLKPGENDAPEKRIDALDSDPKDRLKALGYNFPTAKSRFWASPVYSNVGCLVSAIAFLHEQKIRHKDLKPSNILLSRDRLWLSDFGSATDFSMLSQSATDNERGTPRYFSPEVAAWKPNGRAADIFSLGCILLEILVLHDRGSLEHIRQNRSQDPSFHSNLDKNEIWRTSHRSETSHRRHFLLQEIGFMLRRDPAARPTAKQLLTRVTGYDLSAESRFPLFGDCCKSVLRTTREYKAEVAEYRTTIQRQQNDIEKAHREIEMMHFEISHWKSRWETERRVVFEKQERARFLEADNKKLKEEVQSLVGQQREQKEEYYAFRKYSTNHMHMMKDAHQKELLILDRNHAKELGELKDNHKAELMRQTDSVKSFYNQTLKASKEAWEKEKADLTIAVAEQSTPESLRTRALAHASRESVQARSVLSDQTKKEIPFEAFDEAQARVLKVERHLAAEKQLSATLEDALIDLETSNTITKTDLSAYKEKCAKLEEELEMMRKESNGPDHDRAPDTPPQLNQGRPIDFGYLRGKSSDTRNGSEATNSHPEGNKPLPSPGSSSAGPSYIYNREAGTDEPLSVDDPQLEPVAKSGKKPQLTIHGKPYIYDKETKKYIRKPESEEPEFIYNKYKNVLDPNPNFREPEYIYSTHTKGLIRNPKYREPMDDAEKNANGSDEPVGYIYDKITNTLIRKPKYREPADIDGKDANWHDDVHLEYFYDKDKRILVRNSNYKGPPHDLYHASNSSTQNSKHKGPPSDPDNASKSSSQNSNDNDSTPSSEKKGPMKLSLSERIFRNLRKGSTSPPVRPSPPLPGRGPLYNA